jgi:predicted RNA-binding protein YlxR (DUF448 family)
VACREVLQKKSLIRIVRTPDGIQIDPTGKLAGRGAYLHAQKSCWEKGLKGALASALKTELSTTNREKLGAYAASFSDTLNAMGENLSLDSEGIGNQK